MPQVDTVGDKYYKPLERAEAAGVWLFWAVSILSVVALFVNRTDYPIISNMIQIAFICGVLLFFIQGQAQKLYFFPQAEDKRRQELLSNSYGAALTHEGTIGYYNNDQSNPSKRLAASVMESAFFTTQITRKMLVAERTKTFGYLVLYFLAVYNRSTNLELLAAAAQVLFSENIIAKWLRMEWLRIRSEQVFQNLRRLFAVQPSFSRPIVQSQVVDLFSFYETTKSTATILLSSDLFYKNNDRLTAEWELIRKGLGL